MSYIKVASTVALAIFTAMSLSACTSHAELSISDIENASFVYYQEYTVEEAANFYDVNTEDITQDFLNEKFNDFQSATSSVITDSISVSYENIDSDEGYVTYKAEVPVTINEDGIFEVSNADETQVLPFVMSLDEEANMMTVEASVTELYSGMLVAEYPELTLELPGEITEYSKGGQQEGNTVVWSSEEVSKAVEQGKTLEATGSTVAVFNWMLMSMIAGAGAVLIVIIYLVIAGVRSRRGNVEALAADVYVDPDEDEPGLFAGEPE